LADGHASGRRPNLCLVCCFADDGLDDDCTSAGCARVTSSAVIEARREWRDARGALSGAGWPEALIAPAAFTTSLPRLMTA